MEFKNLLFWVFSAVLMFSATRVITARNPVHAVLYLVLAFFNASGIWLLLQAEFLAITLVLVYVGAVMVLFLFVVMMLDINTDKLRMGFRKNLPLAIIVGLVVAIEMSAVIYNSFDVVDATWPAAAADNYSNTRELGKLMYTEYVYPIEIAALILLVAMVSAIALTLRHRKDSKYQNAGDQVAVTKNQRLRIVKMAAEPKARADKSAQG
ncbi:NADH-quinone oxidoreductase subunit J [Derxia gummosa]|uniref:NADH-quinone oxidoreductase subunit J n=1 Tax=Derxia gummosa DSM 723 TaxID=1121388 RepID=A0A8B6X1L4_9BURK|nr:NADH-quinone oxidoreductase subunit J [Derxia gummosa]